MTEKEIAKEILIKLIDVKAIRLNQTSIKFLLLMKRISKLFVMRMLQFSKRLPAPNKEFVALFWMYNGKEDTKGVNAY